MISSAYFLPRPIGTPTGRSSRIPGAAVIGTVGDAYRFFRTALASIDDPDDEQEVTRIEQAIRPGLSIVEVTAERGDNVYRIFESLNNTGLQLSQTDLLRNHVFMRLPNRGDDVYRTSGCRCRTGSQARI
jgi:hypothetical protein